MRKLYLAVLFALLAVFALPPSTLQAQTGGGSVPITTGTATLTIVGCTTAPTTTLTWIKIGTGGSGAASGRSIVVAQINPISCTSNSTGLSFTGYPANLLCFSGCNTIALPYGIDNGAIFAGASMQAATTTTITFLKLGVVAGWTNAATSKGIPGFQMAYSTQ
jgi:hypothetical protein